MKNLNKVGFIKLGILAIVCLGLVLFLSSISVSINKDAKEILSENGIDLDIESNGEIKMKVFPSPHLTLNDVVLEDSAFFNYIKLGISWGSIFSDKKAISYLNVYDGKVYQSVLLKIFDTIKDSPSAFSLDIQMKNIKVIYDTEIVTIKYCDLDASDIASGDVVFNLNYDYRYEEWKISGQLGSIFGSDIGIDVSLQSDSIALNLDGTTSSDLAKRDFKGKVGMDILSDYSIFPKGTVAELEVSYTGDKIEMQKGIIQNGDYHIDCSINDGVIKVNSDLWEVAELEYASAQGDMLSVSNAIVNLFSFFHGYSLDGKIDKVFNSDVDIKDMRFGIEAPEHGSMGDQKHSIFKVGFTMDDLLVTFSGGIVDNGIRDAIEGNIVIDGGKLNRGKAWLRIIEDRVSLHTIDTLFDGVSMEGGMSMSLTEKGKVNIDVDLYVSGLEYNRVCDDLSDALVYLGLEDSLDDPSLQNLKTALRKVNTTADINLVIKDVALDEGKIDEIGGSLRFKKQKLDLKKVYVKAGGFDIGASVTLDAASLLPVTELELFSDEFNYEEFRPYIEKFQLPAYDELFGALSSEISRVKLKANKLSHMGVELVDLDSIILVRDRYIKVSKLNFGVCSGEVNIGAKLTRASNRLDMKGIVKNLDAKCMLQDIGVSNPVDGKTSISFEVMSKGSDLNQMMKNLSGDVTIKSSRVAWNDIDIKGFVFGLNSTEELKFNERIKKMKSNLTSGVTVFDTLTLKGKIRKGAMRSDQCIIKGRGFSGGCGVLVDLANRKLVSKFIFSFRDRHDSVSVEVENFGPWGDIKRKVKLDDVIKLLKEKYKQSSHNSRFLSILLEDS